jgi:hypothetical protein
MPLNKIATNLLVAILILFERHQTIPGKLLSSRARFRFVRSVKGATKSNSK